MTRTNARDRAANGRLGDRVAVVAHERKLDAGRAGELRAALEQQGFEVSWRSIRKGSAATKAVQRAVADGAHRIVVAGGDGTVRAAVQALAGGRVPLAVLPTGTANVFASALGLPTEPDEIAAAMRSGATRRIDTARCNDLSFALMAGTGLDAALIDLADDDSEPISKARFGRVAYVRAGIREARRREPFAVRVVVDGTTFFDGEATSVLVANIGTIMGGLDAFPAAHPDDGVLDVAVITAAGWREWGSLVFDAVRHRQRSSGHVHLTQGTKISIRPERPHRIELDGGSKGTVRRLEIRVLPASLSVVVSRPDGGEALAAQADHVDREDAGAVAAEVPSVAPVRAGPEVSRV